MANDPTQGATPDGTLQSWKSRIEFLEAGMTKLLGKVQGHDKEMADLQATVKAQAERIEALERQPRRDWNP